MLTVEQLRQRSRNSNRPMITPKVEVRARTTEQKRVVTEVARRVIREHYDVLMALKDR